MSCNWFNHQSSQSATKKTERAFLATATTTTTTTTASLPANCSTPPSQVSIAGILSVCALSLTSYEPYNGAQLPYSCLRRKLESKHRGPSLKKLMDSIHLNRHPNSLHIHIPIFSLASRLAFPLKALRLTSFALYQTATNHPSRYFTAVVGSDESASIFRQPPPEFLPSTAYVRTVNKPIPVSICLEYSIFTASHGPTTQPTHSWSTVHPSL